MIKFGSRTDVLFDPDAEVKVRAGDRVRGGETVLAIVGTAKTAAAARAGERSSTGGE
jgi:phosphatidylserine decarboxylase